jgi:hypothetical protein
MSYFIYEKQTGLYRGKVETEPTYLLNLGYGYTTIEPSEDLLSQIDKYHKLAFDEKRQRWKLIPDFRGIWWNKETKEKLVIEEIGIEVDLTEYTDKEPCEFCVWSDDENDWIFSLELYREHVLKVVLNKFYEYLLQREPIIHQTAITGIMIRTLTILSTNKSLTDEQIDYLANVIQECDSVFTWISQVTEYELQLEDKVKSASTKEEIDEILASINYEQFDSTYKYVTIGDKITEISKIQLTATTDNSEVS